MSARFAELDWQDTPMGELSLRRRREPVLDVDVYEVKLGDEYLMSSLFVVAEVALATAGLAAVEGDQLAVVVGGLGLGYTAQAVLHDQRVASMHVVETQPAVIDWHRRLLLPVSSDLVDDERCHLVEGDFFALTAGSSPYALGVPDRLDAILVDIDHTPTHLLHPSHGGFYSSEGLARLAERLRPGGVFGLWSDDPPAEAFVHLLAEVFPTAGAEIVAFDNPLTGGSSANTVYVATT
jgi:spermidine synthase